MNENTAQQPPKPPVMPEAKTQAVPQVKPPVLPTVKAPVNPYEPPKSAAPVFPPQSGASVPQTPLPPKKSRKGLIAIIVAIIVLLAIGTTTIVVLWDRVQGMSLLSQQKDETMIADTLDALMTIASFDVKATTSQRGEAFGLSQDGEANFVITGVFDSKGKENGNFSIESESSGAVTSQKGGIVNIGSRSYFKLSGFSEVPIISDAIDDRWIDLGETKTNPLEAFSGLDLMKLRSSFLNNHVLSVSKNLGDEKVNDKNTTHYELSFNRNGALVFVQDMAKLMDDTTIDTTTLNSFLTSVEMKKFDVWVGKTDSYPYRIALEIEVLENPEVHLKNGSLTATIDLLNANVQKNIVAPESVTAEEAIEPAAATFVTNLFNASIAKIFSAGVPTDLPDADGDGLDDAVETLLKTDPTKADTDGDGQNDKAEFAMMYEDANDADSDTLPDSLETFIGTDPAKADTDGDGFSDGDEVKNGYNPKGDGKLFE